MPRKKKVVEEAPVIETVEEDKVYSTLPVEEEFVEVMDEEQQIEILESIPDLAEQLDEIIEDRPELFVSTTPDIEEVVEAPVVTPDHTMDGWWTEIGNRLKNRGYGNNTIVRRAKIAYGQSFNADQYETYCATLKNRTVEGFAKGVWLSQK